MLKVVIWYYESFILCEFICGRTWVEGNWTSQNFKTQDINMGELVATIYCFYKFLSDFGYVYILVECCIEINKTPALVGRNMIFMIIGWVTMWIFFDNVAKLKCECMCFGIWFFIWNIRGLRGGLQNVSKKINMLCILYFFVLYVYIHLVSEQAVFIRDDPIFPIFLRL